MEFSQSEIKKRFKRLIAQLERGNFCVGQNMDAKTDGVRG